MLQSRSSASIDYIDAALAECQGFTQSELDQGVISCMVEQFPVMADWLERCHRALGTEMFLELCPISEEERITRMPQMAALAGALSVRVADDPVPALLRALI